jgi:hypothetical protein
MTGEKVAYPDRRGGGCRGTFRNWDRGIDQWVADGHAAICLAYLVPSNISQKVKPSRIC